MQAKARQAVTGMTKNPMVSIARKLKPASRPTIVHAIVPRRDAALEARAPE